MPALDDVHVFEGLTERSLAPCRLRLIRRDELVEVVSLCGVGRHCIKQPAAGFACILTDLDLRHPITGAYASLAGRTARSPVLASVLEAGKPLPAKLQATGR